MTKIWAYGNSQTKTATGKKWEGNVIAVPKGYELGKLYTITYVEDGVEKTITAMAVDRTPEDSFSAPKGSEIAKALHGKNVEISPQKPSIEIEQKTSPTIDDKQLAHFLNQYSSVKDMSCQACIRAEKAHLAEFVQAISEHGTPAHLATLNEVLGIKQNAEFPAIASFMQASGIKADLLAGGYYIAQTSGKNGFVPFAQAGAKYEFADGWSANAGASIRPNSEPSGKIGAAKFNPLELNVKKEFADDLSVSAGLSTWIGNHNYQRDPLSSSTLSCGCTGGAGAENSAPPARDGIFSAALNEFSIAGIHAEKKISAETFLRASVGAPVNSQIFDSNVAALAAIRHKFSENLEGSATIAAQTDQMQVNSGVAYEFENKAKIGANPYVSKGARADNVGVELRATMPVGKKTTLSATAFVERDFAKDASSANIRLGAEHKITDNLSIGAFGFAGSNGKDKEFGGGIGGSFKF